MRIQVLLLSVAVALACWACPAQAQGRGRMSVGAVVWGQNTKLEVDRATDFDGTDNTAEQAVKDWNVQGSGMGFRLHYAFPKLLGIYGEVGAEQATVRDRNVLDANQGVTSRGLDTGLHFGIGANIGGKVPEQGDLFWSAGAGFSSASASLDEVDRKWQYDETAFHLDGKVGRWVRSVALYGGARYAHYHGSLDTTDLTRLPGQQVQNVGLKRDGGVDLLLGAQTGGQNITGFAELGLVGTLSASTGLAFQF